MTDPTQATAHTLPAITLANDGSQRAGTFAAVVRTLITDILDDGEGLTASITTSDRVKHTGTVIAIDQGEHITPGQPRQREPRHHPARGRRTYQRPLTGYLPMARGALGRQPAP